VKRCSKCKKNKFESEFSFKIKNLGTLQSQCKECTRVLIKNHYNVNKGYYLEKAHIRNGKLRNETLDYINKYLKNSSCKDCGEKDIVVLEFDHRDRATKFKAVSSLIRSRYPLNIIKMEVEKCDVRCANCHRRKTAVDLGWFKK
jgi:type I site-specific restriction endonuclease